MLPFVFISLEKYFKLFKMPNVDFFWSVEKQSALLVGVYNISEGQSDDLHQHFILSLTRPKHTTAHTQTHKIVY